ncbi:peptidoglycan/xylan/chitin deacetylase (PgdA/CDA1 family) [Symbiobacterium terraclitae]|uniref:Peptidoglycan/xylan/chitin deacetylase (PgdA/CDA1 family) n=1 Tax=Symbiobacterium terraclitae TaxID=557451 RepID=A0ABS4JM72_9FIRM|nr:polysaccharide deacetylase family protein [Symbiobacterium terraclitae]MBP2016649.1 peptidoglycan/xylan/chitin deacetylase (PgdA/CDA1 family) [Symbiobacterium terraclitae]
MSATRVRAAALLIVLALAASCAPPLPSGAHTGVPRDPAGTPAPPEEPGLPASPGDPQGPEPPVPADDPQGPQAPQPEAPDASPERPGDPSEGTQEPPAQDPRGQEDPARDPLPEVPEGEPSRLVVHGDRSCSMVALTYDAGSGADGAEAILDVLREHGLQVTFFLTGRWAEQFPDLARRIADEGHEIANHTYSHPDLTTIPDEEVLQQIRDGEEAIRAATGRDPRPLFREPYGAFSEHERRLVRAAGYSYSIYWDVDTLDWTFPGVEATTERILRAQGGSIVLMHLNVADSAAATAAAIPVLQARGYEIVPVSRLLQCTADEPA